MGESDSPYGETRPSSASGGNGRRRKDEEMDEKIGEEEEEEADARRMRRWTERLGKRKRKRPTPEG